MQVQTLESKQKVQIGPDLSDMESALTRGLQKEQKNRQRDIEAQSDLFDQKVSKLEKMLKSQLSEFDSELQNQLAHANTINKQERFNIQQQLETALDRQVHELLKS